MAPLHDFRRMATAHRAAQTDHRAALAADDRGGIRAADWRARAVLTALVKFGASELATRLDAETRSGDALLVALTCENTGPDGVDDALADYQRDRGLVEALLAVPSTAATGS